MEKGTGQVNVRGWCYRVRNSNKMAFIVLRDATDIIQCVVEKSKILDKSNIKEGHQIIGIDSSGIHSNGYSLVRKIFFKDNNLKLSDFIPELNKTLGEELLTPTKIYVKGVLATLKEIDVKGIAHITGGGFIENIPRVLPEHLGVTIFEKSLPKMPIFSLLEKLGNVNHLEMYNIFNMGIGMVLIVDTKDTSKTIDLLHENGLESQVIGVVNNSLGVEII